MQPYTYSFDCAGGELPSGMGFAPATRVFAGTPDARFRDSCTYTVTDRSRPIATVTAAVEVEVIGAATQPLALPPLGKLTLRVGTFHSELLPVAMGGVQPYAYSFDCAGGQLPSGTGFAPTTRAFAGTPDARFRDSCTYTVTDRSRPSATVTAAVEVEVIGAATQPLAFPGDVVVGDGDSPPNLVSLTVERRAWIMLAEASGGVQPYTYEFECELPRGLGFSPDTRILSGTPLEIYRGPDCAYRVSDSDSPPSRIAKGVALVVSPLDLETWRFRTRSLSGSEHPLHREAGVRQDFVILPHAVGGTGKETYELLDIDPHLAFDPANRVLSYRHTGVDPILDTPTTYRYQVSVRDDVHDALCVDIAFLDKRPPEFPDDLLDGVNVRVRDDARWNGAEFRCPDAAPPAAPASRNTLSNPVHAALAPIHARRAADVAHDAVRDRVRGWSPGSLRPLSAFAPKVGIGSLSGRSEGFDYSGSSESASVGAEFGVDSWQAGVVASFTGTDLDYRAAAGLSERGYRTGEHRTEIFSLHPFAAWHVPSGGHLWASFGAGTGELRHRDDLGFPSWSRSDVRLRVYGAGASLPLADLLSGELQAEAGIESFALEIEGGGRISSSLPRLRGRDWRAGLAWSAPVPGAPSVSMAYRRLTGDGPEGGRLETKGSTSVEGVFDPRLTLVGSVEGSFGLGDYEHDSWGLAGGVRFVPGGPGRGLGLELDTRLVSLDDGGAADVGIQGEAGYGLWGGPLLGALRPYVGLTRYPADGSLRRSLGVDLRETPNARVKVELYDHSRDRLRALEFTLDHRF